MYGNHILEAMERTFSDVGKNPFDSAASGARLALLRELLSSHIGWSTMNYACVGNENRTPRGVHPPCGFQWSIWLTLGVEGPTWLRELGAYIACPFYAGTCPNWKCKGQMRHVAGTDRFRDEVFTEPRLVPDDVPRFVLPTSVYRGDEGARLLIPEPALVKARVFVHEQMGVEL